MHSAKDDCAVDVIYRKIAWRIMPILLLAYIVAYLDRANVGFAKLHFMDDLGFSEAIFGLGGGLFYLGYSLFEVPSNMMLARWGARATLSRIMILWSLCSMAFALMATPLHYYILRFLLGVAEAGFFPGVLLYLSYWIPADRRARYLALFMGAMPLAGIFGGPLSGMILDFMNGVAGLTGWQWMFILEGAPAALLGVVTIIYLTDTPAKASWLSAKEKAAVKAEMEKSTPAQGDENSARRAASIFQTLFSLKFVALALMSSALIAGLGGLSLWLPTAIRDAAAGQSALVIGLFTAIPYLIGLIAQQSVARIKNLNLPLAVSCCALVGAAGWILAALIPGRAPTIFCLSLASAGMFAATGPFWALVTVAFSRKAAPAGIAAVTTAGSVAAFLAPAIAGKLMALAGAVAPGQFLYGALVASAGAAVFLNMVLPQKNRAAGASLKT